MNNVTLIPGDDDFEGTDNDDDGSGGIQGEDFVPDMEDFLPLTPDGHTIINKVPDMEIALECIEDLQKLLPLEELPGSENFRSTYLFRDLEKEEPYYVFAIKESNMEIGVVDTHVLFNNPKGRLDEYSFIGHLRMPEEYPATAIQKETLRDWIIDLFVKGDIDLPRFPDFSRRFQVVSKDRSRLQTLFQKMPLDEFVAFPDLTIELDGHNCLFISTGKPMGEENTPVFARLAMLMLKIFG